MADEYEWATRLPNGNACKWDSEEKARRAHAMIPDHPVLKRKVGPWVEADSPERPELEEPYFIEGRNECIADVWYRLRAFTNATNPITQAAELIGLNDSIHDLVSYHPNFDYKTGEIQWPDEEEA